MSSISSLLLSALRDARKNLSIAHQEWLECDCDDDECLHYKALQKVTAWCDHCFDAYLESSDPRYWDITIDDSISCTQFVGTMSEAMSHASTIALSEPPPESLCSAFSRATVVCPDTNESSSQMLVIDPVEPECSRRGADHDWDTRPLYIGVGATGLRPGARANGAGLIITEYCANCGCAKITNTYAQCPTDGTQGHTTVQYVPGEFLENLEKS